MLSPLDQFDNFDDVPFWFGFLCVAFRSDYFADSFVIFEQDFLQSVLDLLNLIRQVSDQRYGTCELLWPCSNHLEFESKQTAVKRRLSLRSELNCFSALVAPFRIEPASTFERPGTLPGDRVSLDSEVRYLRTLVTDFE